jgi:hypothetical protein
MYLVHAGRQLPDPLYIFIYKNLVDSKMGFWGFGVLGFWGFAKEAELGTHIQVTFWRYDFI